MTVLCDADLPAACDRSAHRDDTLVAANPGYGAQPRRLPHPGTGPRLVDLGRGPGASTAALARVLPDAETTAVDARAGALADTGVNGPFDALFAAYPFRDVEEPHAVLFTVHEPHGRLAVHEYTLGGRPPHRAVWTAVSRGLVPPVATALGDGDLYRHLWRSVVEFDTVDRFPDRVRGFERVQALPLPGRQTGINRTVVARRTSPAAGSGQ